MPDDIVQKETEKKNDVGTSHREASKERSGLDDLPAKEELVSLALQTRQSPKGIEVLAITAGIGNGWTFSEEVLLESLPLWEKVQCFTDHTLGNHSVRDLGGMVSEPQWDEEQKGIKALLTPAGPAAQVIKDLAEAAIAFPEMPLGLSADLFIQPDGRTVKKILKVRSLDAVHNPARGGKFVRVLQERVDQPPANNEKENQTMSNATERTNIPLDPNLQSVLSEAEANLIKLQAGAQAVIESQKAQDAVSKLEQTNAAADRLRMQMCQALLSSTLAASKLPDAVVARIRDDFTDKVFEPEDLQKRIDADRLMLSGLTAGRAVQSQPRGVFNSQDFIEAAVDDLFGAPRRPEIATVSTSRLSGIRELYMLLTGDRELHGGYYPEHVQFATTADFSGLVKNALNKLIAEHWREMGCAGYDWWTNIVDIQHFETLNDITATLVGTVGALPTVLEGAEYTELAVGDSPETGSFVKKGGYIPLTLELIDRDETRKLKAYPRELANAGLRTISALVAAVFTDNAGVGPTLTDTGALFNNVAVTTKGGHANLLTTDLTTQAVWDAAAMAVYDQPMLIKNDTGYYGTGPKLAVEPKFCLTSRHKTQAVRALFLNDWDVTDNKHASNLLKGSVVPITVPDWTDDDNWAAVCDPKVAPAIIVGERFGIMPEIFIANRETDPAVFMNDEHRMKVRHFVAVLVADFRPLHKSNV